MNYPEKNVARNAMQRGELKAYMMGEGKYEYSSDKNDPGPFDVGSVLDDFYALYEENPRLGADKILDNTLREMLDGSVKEILASILYIYIQKKYEKIGLAKFILDNNILGKVNQVVHDRRAELEATNGMKELYIDQNIMQVLRNINNRGKNEYGFALFQE